MTDALFLERLDLAVKLRRYGDYSYARRVALDLSLARPEEYAVWHTLGQIWTETGEFESALACHEEAWRRLTSALSIEGHRDQYTSAAMGLAQARMRVGRFYDAWDLWEVGRLGVSWQPSPGAGYWIGGPAGKAESLIVQSEGGYGDLFMFSRWLPLLKLQCGWKRVGLVTWPSLRRFRDWSALGVDQFYAIGEDIIGYDEWQYATSIMSMLAMFKVRGPENIPPVDAHWHPQKGDGRLRIGFCWRAEENTSPVRTKSLTLPQAQAVVDQLPKGSEVLSLSPEKADLYSAGEFTSPERMKVERGRMLTWDRTEEYIRTMDFVISVDSAVLHLCGLIGIPTLGLIPCASCWRWGRCGVRSGPWYGPALTYYRQPRPLDWDAGAIVKAVTKRLEEVR